MKLITAIIFASLASLGAAQGKMHKYQLVFLMANPRAPKMTEAQNGEFMQKHLAFLEGLWTKGTSRAIGPLPDSGRMEGVLILDLPDRMTAQKALSEEPGIKSGVFTANYLEFWCEDRCFAKAPKFMDLENLYFGYFERAANAPKLDPKVSEALMTDHLGNLNKMAQDGLLVLAGPLVGGSKMRGLIVFRGIDKKKILEATSRDPYVQRGVFTVTLHPWVTSKGTFPGFATAGK